MTPLPVETATDARWDFAYDDEWFLPLPTARDLAGDGGVEAWVDAAVERYASRSTLTDGDLDAIRLTAQGLAGLAGNAATQLWFIPRGVYSDVLVEITVADAEALDERAVLEAIATLPDSAASELIQLETDTHGNGFLLRRTSAVVVDGAARPIANWTVMLRAGEWVIMIEAMGSTLESFALMEEHILRVIDGITLPA